jgi:hypothetical protein
MNVQLVKSLVQIINNLTPEEKKLLVIDTELFNNNSIPPFYETATKEEWIKAFEKWSKSHGEDTPLLSDYAVSRESIYEE